MPASAGSRSLPTIGQSNVTRRGLRGCCACATAEPVATLAKPMTNSRRRMATSKINPSHGIGASQHFEYDSEQLRTRSGTKPFAENSVWDREGCDHAQHPITGVSVSVRRMRRDNNTHIRVHRSRLSLNRYNRFAGNDVNDLLVFVRMKWNDLSWLVERRPYRHRAGAHLMVDDHG